MKNQKQKEKRKRHPPKKKERKKRETLPLPVAWPIIKSIMDKDQPHTPFGTL